MLSNKVKGFAAGILAAVFYGTNPLGTLPLYADGINSGSVLFYRYAIAVAMFAVWMVCAHENFRIKWGESIKFAILGSFFAMSSATLYLSFHYMDSGIASTLLFSYPIITALLMVLFFHERVTWLTGLSILLVIIGIALLYRNDGNTTLSKTGIALVMLSSLLYAVYIISVNKFTTGYSSLKFTFWIVFFGLVTITVFTFIAGQPIMMLHGIKEWSCGIQLALLPTVLSLFFMTISIKYIGSTPSAIMGALEPVTAVFIGVFIFGESFSFRFAIGIILILSAVTLIILRKKDRK